MRWCDAQGPTFGLSDIYVSFVSNKCYDSFSNLDSIIYDFALFFSLLQLKMFLKNFKVDWNSFIFHFDFSRQKYGIHLLCLLNIKK